jgi:membrane protease YdiL (CAAX protease family)
MEIPFAIFLALAGIFYFFATKQAVGHALSREDAFPAYRWKWPEAAFSMGIASFFVFTALASIGKPPGKIDLASLQSSLALYGGLVLFLIGFLVYQNVPIHQAFGLHPKNPAGAAMASIVAFFLCLPGIYAAQWMAYAIIGPDTAPQPIVTFLMDHPAWGERLFVFAIAAIAAPVTEELIFRGCLYGFLRQSTGRIAALAISSVVFALIHAHPATMPALAIFAVGLALLYECTGTLWAPIAVHALFNILNFFGSLYWPDLLK